MKKRMLITGVSGLLGNNLSHYFQGKYDLLGIYHSHPVDIQGVHTEPCDICDHEAVAWSISNFCPHIIIHCASLADVDGCEMDPERTRAINVLGTRHIVQALKGEDTKLVYISTDAVYDGIKGNFSENAFNVRPRNLYGVSKYEGELEVLKRDGSLVLRTNIFGWNILDKLSLGEWVLHGLTSGQVVKGFQDALFSSIYTMELARVIDLALQRRIGGVYNCGALKPCSKYEFAVKIAGTFDMDKTLVRPISIEDFHFKAKRGKNLSMNVEKLQKDLNYRLPSIDYSIECFYRDYKSGFPAEIKKNRAKDPGDNEPTPYGRQWLDIGDIEAAVEVLRSRKITQGPAVEEFEEALARHCQCRYAVAVNSGTSALHIACLAAGVNEGAEVITSPITFVASANCAVYCGGLPVFADIDDRTYNLSPEGIEKRLGKKTRAIIPVHFAGQSCAMQDILSLVKAGEKKWGEKIFIIEDGSHALGSKYRDTVVGSCRYSDMTSMSFHPVKHITTGEGGAVLTNDETLYKRLRRYRSHGVTNTPDELIQHDLAFQRSQPNGKAAMNPWYYEQQDLGYNFRITNIQCAIGISQLKKLPRFQRRRRKIVDAYNRAFKGIETLKIPFESKECESNFHLYVLLFDFEKIGMERAQLMLELKRAGIQTQVHYIPVYLQPFYRQRFGTRWGDCPRAERYYEQCLSIPLFPAMGQREVRKVIEEIKRVAEQKGGSE